MNIPGIIIVIGFIVLIVWKPIYWLKPHIQWRNDAIPSLSAKISDVRYDKAYYAGKVNKIKTTIEFSDGFSYITFLTNTTTRWMGYTVSVDEDLMKTILENAVVAHKEAVEKKLAG